MRSRHADPVCTKACIADVTVNGATKAFYMAYPQSGAAVLRISNMNYTHDNAAGASRRD